MQIDKGLDRLATILTSDFVAFATTSGVNSVQMDSMNLGSFFCLSFIGKKSNERL
jgi:hypothetical protein